MVKESTTQKNENNTVKKDTLNTVISQKNEYPEATDTLKVVNSGYFLLKDEVEVLKKEVNALKLETNGIKEDTKALKVELEMLKKEKAKK